MDGLTDPADTGCKVGYTLDRTQIKLAEIHALPWILWNHSQNPEKKYLFLAHPVWVLQENNLLQIYIL